jgi:hypothetical protein
MAAVNVTAQPNIVREHSTSALDPIISHVGDGIFLQTKTAQGLAGIFVWIALFLTCQQVILQFRANENARSANQMIINDALSSFLIIS